MTRDQAIEIARRMALNSHESYAYLPVTDAEAKQWLPHEWVIDAILWATMQRDQEARRVAESDALVISSLKRERDDLHNRLHDQARNLRPLSDAAVAELWVLLKLSSEPSSAALARAVERAHGIEADDYTAEATVIDRCQVCGCEEKNSRDLFTCECPAPLRPNAELSGRRPYPDDCPT